MLLFSTFCAIIIGWFLGGRLSRFEQAELRWLILPVISMLSKSAMPRLPDFLTPVILVCSYLLLFLFLWRNRHLPLPAVFMGLGSLCNLVVIAINGFAMPVSERALTFLSPEGAAMLTAGEVTMYRIADPATRMLFLGDIFWFPVPYFRGFASIGDILLCIGVFFLLMAIMAPAKLGRLYKNKPFAEERRY